jgi:hypothetical protein
MLALIGLAALGPAAAPAVPAATSCTTVRGTVSFYATGPDSFISSLTGDLAGTSIGTHFTIVKVGDDGTLHFTVDHEFVTDRGTFFTVAEGVLSPITPGIYRTSERNFFLPGGTGAFAGATGNLILQTLADLTVGEGSGRYHGRICV